MFRDEESRSEQRTQNSALAMEIRECEQQQKAAYAGALASGP